MIAVRRSSKGYMKILNNLTFSFSTYSHPLPNIIGSFVGSVPRVCYLISHFFASVGIHDMKCALLAGITRKAVSQKHPVV
jgi:hypothetical protein